MPKPKKYDNQMIPLGSKNFEIDDMEFNSIEELTKYFQNKMDIAVQDLSKERSVDNVVIYLTTESGDYYDSYRYATVKFVGYHHETDEEVEARRQRDKDVAAHKRAEYKRNAKIRKDMEDDTLRELLKKRGLNPDEILNLV